MPVSASPPASIESFHALAQPAPAAAIKVAPPSSWTERASPLGTNLAEPGPFGTDPAFSNWFKEAEAWVGGAGYTFDRKDRVDVDALGNVRSLKPGQYAKALLCHNTLQHHHGVFTISWEGQGKFEIVGGSIAHHDPQYQVLEVKPGQGPTSLGICMKSMDPANPPRNLRVHRHADKAQRPDFHIRSEFIDRLVGVYSGLRFMDWARVNGWREEVNGQIVARPHPVRGWHDRSTVGDATWCTPNGVPWEVMIELCNRTQMIPYVNVPHTYMGSAMGSLMELWHQRLHPSSPIYVSHSNEVVWNTQFPQGEDCKKWGVNLNLDADPFSAGLKYHAWQTAQIASLARRMCPGRRVFVVLEGQFSVPSRYTLMLQFIKDAAELGITHLGSGIYFGNDLGRAQLLDPDHWPAVKDPDWGKKVDAMTVDQVIEHLLAEAVPNTIAAAKKEVDLAKAHGLELLAYEGGQHLSGVNERLWDAALTAKLVAANRSPRMAEVYAKFLGGLRDAGVHRPFLFTHTGPFTQWGSWGSMEGQWQPPRASPKRAAITKASGWPKWW